jgi:hypothetical protein
MSDTFILIFSVLLTIFTVFYCVYYFRLYRRIQALKTFTNSQRRVLIYQLLAISLWTTAAIGLSFYTAWSGFNLDRWFRPPGNIIIAVLNWITLGFVAVTSIVPGVSIVPTLRNWMLTEPARGRTSIIIGIVILGLLAYGTWKVLLPGL